jgi:hypothetical protein
VAAPPKKPQRKPEPKPEPDEDADAEAPPKLRFDFRALGRKILGEKPGGKVFGSARPVPSDTGEEEEEAEEPKGRKGHDGAEEEGEDGEASAKKKTSSPRSGSGSTRR